MRVLLVVLAAMGLSGCATRSYVDSEIRIAQRKADAEQHDRHMRIVEEVCDTQREIDRLKKSLSRSSETRKAMHADDWRKRLDEIDLELKMLRKEIE